MKHFDWPQIIWVGWAMLSLGFSIAGHGRPFEQKRNAWAKLGAVGINTALLTWGGFFGTAHAQVPPAAAHYRAELVRAAHSQWGLDAPIAALAAQVHQESAWNPQAVSRVGARGLAQFMPATARWWCEINGLSADAAAPGRPKQGSAPSGGGEAHEVASVGAPSCQPHNPTWALRALVGYDRWLYQRTPPKYNAHDRMWVALRAYNGGLGNWRAEAAALGAAQPTRAQVDAACGTARRHPLHCAENVGYPTRILTVLQPRYATWGRLL